MSGIKEIIKSYISIDDEMKVLRKQLSALKSQRDSYSEQIYDYLKENSGETNAVLEIGKDSFKIVTTIKKKVNRTALEETIKQKADPEVASSILSEIIEEKEESHLKRMRSNAS
jgi:predicted S18 family serine protease